MKNTIPAHQIKNENLKMFFYAGKSIITLRNLESGNRYTYKITAPKDQDPKKPIFFVKVMTGSDNENSYTFLGTIFDFVNYKHSQKSSLKADDVRARVIAGFLKFVNNNVLPKSVEAWHEGRCGKCGKKLTVPESVYSGLGPICIGEIKENMIEATGVTVITKEMIEASKNVQHIAA